MLIDFEVLNRSDVNIELTAVKSVIDQRTISKEVELMPNIKINFQESIFLKTTNFSDPYWLRNQATMGMYAVAQQDLIGKPETPKLTKIEFHLIIHKTPIIITKNIIRRYAERDKGEIYEPFEILPKVTTKLTDKVLVFPKDQAQKVW